MLSFESGNLHVTIRNEPTYTPDSADNVRRYDREIALFPDGQIGANYVSSRYGVAITETDGKRRSCILLAGGGATSVHEHSAVLRSDCLYLACGNTISAIGLPDLEVRWWRAVDFATCFGVYELPGSSGLISHGELSIARISVEGSILWTASGPDIFSGPLTMFSDHVRVIDWHGTTYRFSITDGRVLEDPPEGDS